MRGGLHCAPDAYRVLAIVPVGAVRVSGGPVTSDRELEMLREANLEVREA